MYVCPNCGGNLKFDISSQQMHCQYCNSYIDPYEVSKETDAQENVINNMTYYTCPQCGGELISMDNEATTYCSFCGASTILSNRLSVMKKPDYIIPFQLTKEDCKKIYRNLLQKSIFVPRAYKDPKFIDQFRAIYMPYWVYKISQQGEAMISGVHEKPSMGYLYTDYCNFYTDVDAYYYGLSYDASSSFSDSISEAILPYDYSGLQYFTSSYLSGFYTDVTDVESKVYEEEATFFANQQTYEKIKKQPEFKDYNIKEIETIENFDNSILSKNLHTKCEEYYHVLLPVWFLSYRNKDRITYATINGQNGKAFMNLPIDIKKYLFGSLFLALPIFFLLNILISIKATDLLLLSIIMICFTMFVYKKEIKKLYKKETNESDLGLWAKYSKDRKKRPKRRILKEENKVKNFFENVLAVLIFLLLSGVEIIGLIGLAYAALSYINQFLPSGNILTLILIIICFISIVSNMKAYKKMTLDERTSFYKKRVPGFLCTIISVMMALVISIFNPPQDYYYYICTICCFISISLTIIKIIKEHNIMTTRKLPQFNRTGGDDLA